MNFFDLYVIFGIPAIAGASALALYYFTRPKGETRRHPTKP